MELLHDLSYQRGAWIHTGPPLKFHEFVIIQEPLFPLFYTLPESGIERIRFEVYPDPVKEIIPNSGNQTSQAGFRHLDDGRIAR